MTLADIARAAGTSSSTASRALSGRGYVSADAKDRLLKAATRLGYVPNASARTLKQRTSRVIGVVVSDLRNQFYARLAAGIEQTLRAADYQMVLLSHNSESAEELTGVLSFLAMRAPGVIMTPVGRDATRLLAQHGVAVVEVDRRLAEIPCDAVVIDNELGARDVTAHLLEQGHRRIALLVGATDWTTDIGRVRGYRAAHREAAVPVDERLILRIEPQAQNANGRIAQLLDAEAPTAIFGASNLFAEQAWHVLRGRRLELPRDVSLVAFDDMPWMTMVDPGITTVAQPTDELGRHAARLLVRRIEDPLCEQRVECLQPSLVVRGSSGPPS